MFLLFYFNMSNETQKGKVNKSKWYTYPLLILILIILLPLVLIVVSIIFFLELKKRFIIRPRLLQRVRDEWLPKNKFIIFVYCDNPLWKRYAEERIIPRIAPNAIILKWSQRNEWIESDALEAQLFRNFHSGKEFIWREEANKGGEEYYGELNHVAMVFKPWNKPRIINFWLEVRDYKFGKYENINQPRKFWKLKELEKELYSYLP